MTSDGPTLDSNEAVAARDAVALLTAIANADIDAASVVLEQAERPADMVSCLVGILCVEVARLTEPQQDALRHRMRHLAEAVTTRLTLEGHS